MARWVWAMAWLVAFGVAAARADSHEDAARLYAEAAACREAGDVRTAAAKLRQAVDLQPASGDCWLSLAAAYDSLSKLKDAAAAWRRAAELLPPTDPRRAEALAAAAKLDKALAHTPSPVPAPPPPSLADWLPRGPALDLLLLLLASIGGWAAAARYADHRAGAGSDPARFVRLCERLRRGDPDIGRRLVARCASGELRGAAPADFQLLLAAAAGQSGSVRAALADLTRRGERQPQRWAARALASQPQQPAPEIWPPLLSAGDPELRAAALAGLAQVPLPSAIEPLTACALEPDAAVALAAVGILARVEPEAAALALWRVCEHSPQPAAAEAAINALLARARLPAALAPELTRRLASPEAALPARLVTLLGRLGPAGAVGLVAATLHPDGEARAAARHLLLSDGRVRALPPAAEAALEQLVAAQPPQITAELLAVAWEWHAERAAPLLTATWSAGDEALREAALDLVLGRGPAAAGPLVEALGLLPPRPATTGADGPFVTRLCQSLVATQASAAVPELLGRAVRQPAQACWLATAAALAAQGRAGAALAAAAADPSRDLRRLAVELLAQYPAPEAAEALLAELERQDPSSFPHAARALGQLRDKRALPALRSWRPEDGPEADALDVARARLGDADAQQRVEAMLRRERWAERRPAADYFRDEPRLSPRAQAVVREAAAHAAAAAELAGPARGRARRLAELGEAVLPTLQDWLLADEHRRVAARALTLLGHPEATVLAAALDQADQLLARADEAAAAELEQLAADAPPLVRDYLARRRAG
jgi:hypothetical protein